MPTFTRALTFNTIFSNNNNRSTPNFYCEKPIENAQGYSVQSFYGINNFYNIDFRNNLFCFNESDSVGTVRSFILPDGNYTISTFMTALKTGLDLSGSVVYTVSNNTLTNIITITASKSFKILPIPNNCYYEGGFDVSTSFSISQTASSTFDLSGVKILNIVCASFNTGNSTFVNKPLNVIASIPIETPYLGVVNYQPNIAFIDTEIHNVSAFEFQIYDERLRKLNINNDYQLTLLFEM